MHMSVYGLECNIGGFGCKCKLLPVNSMHRSVYCF